MRNTVLVGLGLMAAMSGGAVQAGDCPIEKVQVTLDCERGDNSLEFVQHKGTYELAKEHVVVDVAGRKKLNCEYLSSRWSSEYRLRKQTKFVSDLTKLRALVKEVPDLNPEEKKDAFGQVTQPKLVFRYDGAGRPARALEFDPAFSVGLEELDLLEGCVPYTWEGNDPEIIESYEFPDMVHATRFVIGNTSYESGFGGTYETGYNCWLHLERLDSK